MSKTLISLVVFVGLPNAQMSFAASEHHMATKGESKQYFYTDYRLNFNRVGTPYLNGYEIYTNHLDFDCSEQKALLGVSECVKGGTVLKMGDGRFDASSCDESSEYICFDSKKFRFSIPKQLKVTSNWHHLGLRCEVLWDEFEVFVANEKKNAFYINCSDGKESAIELVFSPRYGVQLFHLLDITIVDGQEFYSTQSSYYLKGGCGFGEAPKCRD